MNVTVSYCPSCGDYLFNGLHRGRIETWCCAVRETKNNERAETEIVTAQTCETISTLPPNETITAVAAVATIISVPAAETIIAETNIAETISVRRGRPRTGTASETITAAKPWAAAGLSRATWYRRMKATG